MPTLARAAKKGIGMRVLLIEDDSATAQSIELMLKSESFNVYTTDLGEEGIDLGKIYDYDIILLDLNLPDMSGFEVLRSLRVSKVKTPILILTGLAGIEDKVRGLGFGADDYMTKPFHKDELVARIHAIVRRSKGHAQSVIQTGDLVVNLDTKTVEVNGARVHLTGKEYQMLELLSLRKGTTSPKRCSSIIFMAGWTNRNSRSLTSLSASCGKSSPTPRAAKITSRRSGAVATFCVNQTKTKQRFPPDRQSKGDERWRPWAPLFLLLLSARHLPRPTAAVTGFHLPSPILIVADLACRARAIEDRL